MSKKSKIRYGGLICLVSFVLVLGLTSNAFAQPADGQIQQTLVAPVIDGLEEDIWWGVLAYPIDQVVVGSATSIQNELDFSATWKALWDSTRIYFLVDVTDDILIFDSPGGGGAWPDMHYDDSVEVHLDADNSKGATYATDDFQYGFRWDDPNTIGTGGNSNTDTTGVEFVILGKTNPKGYICEISIPWSTLGTTPGLGDFIGANIGVNDDDEGGELEFQLTWLVTSGDQWMNPSLFPTMELVTALARGKSWNPNPTDGSMHADTWVNLSWAPGHYAVSHDVYFGDNFDNVNNGVAEAYVGNQIATFLVVGFPGFAYPDGLVNGTNYYWRVDDVEADGTTKYKGYVWSFMIPPRTAYDPIPPDGAGFVDPNVELSWTAGFGAKLHTVYFGDNFDGVNNAAGGLPQGTTTYTPGPLKLAKTYYWRIDEFDAIATYKGDVWSFTTQGAVGNPNPSNGAVDVEQTPVLTWTPGVYGASHEVYFGTDKEAVKNADTGSPEYKGSGNLGSESYDPGKLSWYTTYYWRIDEANNVNPDSPWTGNVWNFTTADFIVIEDFEDYNDYPPDEIFSTWIDGYGTTTNGSLSSHADPPFAETNNVYGGSQSMPLYYDNNLMYSEATMTLTQRNWTEEGVGVLSLWFYGDTSNAAERMYVALNGSAVVYHDNPDAALINKWTQWTIDLQEFAAQGVNLANVNTIAIGFGDKNNLQAGGSGMVLFDDIRLYRPAQ